MKFLRPAGIALSLLVVFSAFCLVTAKKDLDEAKMLTQTLQTELHSVENGNAELRKRIGELENADVLEALARARLGLIKPEDIIFKDIY